MKKKKKKKKNWMDRQDRYFMPTFYAVLCTNLYKSYLVRYILCSADRASLYNPVNKTNMVRNILYS